MPRSTQNQTTSPLSPSKLEDDSNASIDINGTSVLTATSSSITTGAGVTAKSNVFQLSTGGGMYLDSSGYAAAAAGPSYHISGAFAGEVRRIVLHLSMCMNDSGHSSILQHLASSGYSAGDPMSAPDAQRRYHLGIRSENLISNNST